MTAETFYVTGGTIPPDSPSYVERAADKELLAALGRGELCYVLNARQMGKSSLSVRTRQALEAAGTRTAFLDLQKFGSSASAEQWYRALLERIGSDLKLRAPFLTYWRENSDLPPLARLFGALHDVALEQIPGSIVVFLDEIDVVRDLGFKTDEFFGAIRESHNARAADPALRRLTFCIIGTVAPTDLIRDIRLSPFNIGTRVRLADLTPQEAAPLAAPLPGSAKTLERVLWWTNGHPYLTQRLCAELTDSASTDVDAQVARLFFAKSDAEVDENIKNVRNGLLRMGGEGTGFDRTDLLTRYGAITAGKRVPDDDTDGVCTALRLSGLVTPLEGTLRVRNRVYAKLFDVAWVRNNLPDAEVRRQRAVVRRARFQIGGIAVILLLAMGALTSWALLSARQTRAALRLANEATIQSTSEAKAEAAAKLDSDRARKKAEGATRIAETARREAVAAATRAGTALKAETIAKASAVRSAAQAQSSAAAAVLSATQTKKLDYVNIINQAQSDVNSGDFTHAEDLLESVRTSPERAFEWEYLNDLCHPEMRRYAAGMFAMSPDGQLAAMVSGRTVSLVELEKGTTLKTLPFKAVRAVAFADGGQEVLVVSDVGGTPKSAAPAHASVEAYNIATGTIRNIAVIALPQALDIDPAIIHFSGNHKFFAAAASRGMAGIWNVLDGSRVALFPITGLLDTMAVSQSGDRFAISQSKVNSITNGFGADAAADRPVGHISVWDVPGHRLLWTTRRWEAHSSSFMRSLTFSRDGAELFAQSADEATILTTATGKSVPGWPIDAGPDGVSVASTDRTLVAQSGIDKNVFVYRFGAHKPIELHISEVPSTLAFSEDGGLLIVGGDHGTLFLFDATTGAAIRKFRGHSDVITEASVSSDGQRILSTAETTRLWDAARVRSDNALAESASFIQAVSFTPDKRQIAISTEMVPLEVVDSISTNWSLYRSDLSPNGFPFDWSVVGQAVSGDGERFAVLRLVSDIDGRRKYYKLTLVASGKQKDVIERIPARSEKPVEDNQATMLSFSADGEIVSGIVEHRVHRWRFQTGTEVANSFANTSAESLSEDGKYVLSLSGTSHSGFVDYSVRDINNDRLVSAFRLPATESCSYLSPSAKFIAGVDESNQVLLRDGHTGKLITILRGHSNYVAAVAFSPDCRRVATASKDGSARVWDTGSGRLLVKLDLTKITAYGRILAFSRDGLNLVAAQDDGVKVYRSMSEETMRFRDQPQERLRALQPLVDSADFGALLPRVDRLVHRSPAIAGAAAQLLNTAVWTIVNPDSKKKPLSNQISAALGAAERASDLTHRRNGYILGTLAAAKIASGDLINGLATARQAAALPQTNQTVPESQYAASVMEQTLNSFAWNIVNPAKPVPTPDAARQALEIASCAVELSHQRDAAILDTLAAAQFACGNLDLALETERKAVRLSSPDKSMAAAMAADLKRFEAFAAQRTGDKK